MNHQATLDQLKALRLHGMANGYEAILSMPIHLQPTAHELLARLAQQEMESKQNKRTEMFLKLSKLRYAANLEEVICSQERNLAPSQLSELADCNWINRSENVLITGATGCGKSYLACALGHQACLLGHKTIYLNMNRFIEKIHQAKLDGTFIKLLNQMEKTHLIILDDFGLQPINTEARLALLQILEDRYKKKSMIIASQLSVKLWYEYLQDPTLADAILDRLTAHAHRVELQGKSLRHKN